MTLHDDQLTKMSDLSSEFFLSEEDIGKNRAEVVCKKLAELNNYVPTRTHTDVLDADFLKNFRVVVLTNSSRSEQLRISEITHASNIALIIADARGVFAQVFCDFGDTFTVVDTNGEPTVSAMIADVSNDKEGEYPRVFFVELYRVKCLWITVIWWTAEQNCPSLGFYQL